MATVSGQGTTFNLPNYHGELIALSPTETPLLTVAGGLTPGGQGEFTKSPAFEWSTYDLRDADSRPRLEGANAPAAEARARANVENVCQIFHETVETSYSKQAATGQYASPTSAPFYTADGEANPVLSEHDWQVMQSLKQMARDVNFTFWHGTKVKPTSNATARQTGGLLASLVSNVKEKKAKLTGISAATDTLTVTHDLVVGDKFVFTDRGASTAVVVGRAYWVQSVSTTVSFKVSATSGGAAITVGTATMAGYPLKQANTVSSDDANTIMQSVYDAGGISEQETAILFVGSGMKTKVSKAYATSARQANPVTRDIGGVVVNTIETDFGVLGIVLDRHCPQDALVVVSAEQLAPVFLDVPGKGVLFEEELAKVGSADRTQLYGEIGLKYGNEAAHGVFRGFFA